ncbi:MAG: ribose-phosphate diphosphokinase [Thermoplasmata archaeon]
MLIKGPGSPGLCERLEVSESVEVKSKVFPDGEIYVRLEGDVTGEDCVLVQTTYPNKHLIEMLFILDALVENQASSVTTVIPYYSYSRQDKAFKEGECVSSRAIARIISTCADEFYSIDLHSKSIVNFFNVPAENLEAMGLLAEHSLKYEPDMLLSPDEGGRGRVMLASERVGVPWDYLKKTRIDDSTVEIKPKNLGVEGKTVVILDDIISTGGTMMEAAKQLYDKGAEEVHAGCTHGLFVEGSDKKLKKYFESVFCTDTIEGKNSDVTVAPLIKEKVFHRL